MSATATNIRTILIVGGTLAGWMTAAALARALPAGRFDITLVEPGRPVDELDTIGGVASLPALRGFHGLIGLDERDLVAQAGAEFSLGAEFAGWTSPVSSYFRAFSSYGATLEGDVPPTPIRAPDAPSVRGARLLDVSFDDGAA